MVWTTAGDAWARLGKRKIEQVERLGKGRKSLTRDAARRALKDKHLWKAIRAGTRRPSDG